MSLFWLGDTSSVDEYLKDRKKRKRWRNGIEPDQLGERRVFSEHLMCSPGVVVFFCRASVSWAFAVAFSASRTRLVIERQQAAQDFFAGGGADRVADAVVFGQGFDFVEVVAEVEVLPAVGVADGFVEFAVEAAQFEEALVAALRLLPGFLLTLATLAGVRSRVWNRL